MPTYNTPPKPSPFFHGKWYDKPGAYRGLYASDLGGGIVGSCSVCGCCELGQEGG